MGTNWYAHIIPSKSRKEEIKKLIDSNDFNKIVEEVSKTYGNFEPMNMEDPIEGVIHLGKRSGGWKFLWNPNIYQIRNGHLVWNNDKHTESHYVKDPDTPYYVYPLTKEGIKAFIDRKDVEVYDEYGERQDKDEFFKMAVEWTTWTDYKTGEEIEAWDTDSYEDEYPNESGLSMKNGYTDFLESLGYRLSKTKSDFYSDGLRFSTSTYFS